MATPLPLSVENATDPICDIAVWFFLIFSWELSNNNFLDQEINLKGGRIVLEFFLFYYCYCKIVSLGPLKVCI